MISKNPATQKIVWDGKEATALEVEQACSLSRDVFPAWAKTPLTKRIELMLNYKNILKKNEQQLAIAISEETGKPLWESRGEVSSMIAKVDISIEAQNTRCANHLKNGAKTTFKPKGVLAVFGPYNFPGHLPNGHIVPALIAGNTVIFKPSELTPFVGELLVKCLNECGLPSGVVQLLQGGKTTGQALASSKEIDGLLFTGSYTTGKQISQLFGETPEKILALEMGGNNPYVLGQVKQLEQAAMLILISAYISSGQRCTCARRLITLTESPILHTLIPMIHKIKVSSYTETPEPFMGPLIDNNAADKVLEAQQKLIHLGAIPLLLSSRIKEGLPFLTPGLIDVTAVKEKPDEEIFGPLLQVIRVKDFDEAIKEANNTRFGLAAGLLSDNKEQYDLFYDSIRAGVINWNMPLTGASSTNAFGGFGRSGNHRPSAYFAADYCNSPIASLEANSCEAPTTIPPGIL